MTDMRRILVAYDGGEPAQRALTTGITLAKRFDAALAVVSDSTSPPNTSTSVSVERET